MHKGQHEAAVPAVDLGEPGAMGQGGDWRRGPAALTCHSSRCLTGPWISAFLGALTRRGGSMPVTSLRKHLFSAWGGPSAVRP